MSDEVKIWGVGIGPGDPELITLKAVRILQRADVIAYPAPNDGDSLARAIAAQHLPGGQAEIAIRAPMTTERAPAQAAYDVAADEIDARVAEGKQVAILCEGDPLFYGSFMYLFARLASRWKVGIVPGVSSLAACSAELAMPMAARNDVVTVLPAPLEEAALERGILNADVTAIIKVGRHLEKVRSLLERLGLAKQARYVERASMTDQMACALGDLGDHKAPYFSMILVQRTGEVLEL